MSRVLVLCVALALAGAGCGSGDEGSSPTSTTSTTTSPAPSTTTTATTPSTMTTSRSTTTTTSVPAPACDPNDVVGPIDAAVADARLGSPAGWVSAPADAPFVADTADPADWAGILGLDCGAAIVPDDSAATLALVAWTGPRMAFVIRTTSQPEPLPTGDALITVGFDDPMGEYVRDDNSLFLGTLTEGDTIVVGHIDFNLGVAAKTFAASAPPFGSEDPVIRAEEVGILVLEAAGARNVGIAQPPEFGSEEGYIQFVSPTGQILVVDIAPDGWFDPMRPRYYTGDTRTLDVDDITVRITEPADGEDRYSSGVEVGWACAGHVWILQPGANGTGDEAVTFVAEMLQAVDCTDLGDST